MQANPASGQTRNPYEHKLTVGGSSGGSASAVASYMCPLAVTEASTLRSLPWLVTYRSSLTDCLRLQDTGGSTRVPASSNQNFGFDPSRNHYPNDGNPGMTYLCDQLGVNARSIEDIILYDKALTAQPGDADVSALHATASAAVAARPASDLKIGAPLYPFTEPGHLGEARATVSAEQRAKLDGAIAALVSPQPICPCV